MHLCAKVLLWQCAYNQLTDTVIFKNRQKFELKRHPFLLQLIGNLPEEELEKSNLAAKMNSYAAELCSPRIQSQIEAKINEIVRRGWPVLRDI